MHQLSEAEIRNKVLPLRLQRQKKKCEGGTEASGKAPGLIMLSFKPGCVWIQSLFGIPRGRHMAI